tara:strand:+ start:92 stop:256 length:165 start_codon:yes stop_codon:yes gene_type:complete
MSKKKTQVDSNSKLHYPSLAHIKQINIIDGPSIKECPSTITILKGNYEKKLPRK